MSIHLQPITSVEDLDAEPEGSIIAVTSRSSEPLVWLHSGREWLALDPGDRMDGEETTPSFAVFHHHAAAARGRAIIKLWEPGQTGHGVIAGAESLEALSAGSIVLHDEGDWWARVWLRNGREWLELDPSDKSDGETTLPSHLLPSMSSDARILHVFSPADRTVSRG